MRVCSNCFAEGITEDICPFCGQISTASLPSITKQNSNRSSLGDQIDHVDVDVMKKANQISGLYVGLHIAGRYTIQRDFGEKNGWLFYQAVDHQQGRECILKVHHNPNTQILDIPFLLEYSYPSILAPTIIQRKPILVIAIPVRTQVFRPVWNHLSETRKFEILLELVDAIALAHELNLGDIEFHPTKEWLYQVQICSDDARNTYSLDVQQKDFC